LLRLLAGLVAPSAGQVTVLGACRPGSAAAREGVAYLDQQLPLYRNLPVRDVLRVAEAMNPRWDGELARTRLAEQVPVVTVSRAGRQAQALARTSAAPPGWAGRPVTMEELVLGYLREPTARALPGPELTR
jgi:ABC-type multidrug transport system ATPase subunit